MIKKVLSISKFLFLFVLASSFFGCEDEAVLPQVVASFTFNVDNETGSVNFTNTSEEAERFLWNFGDGRTSTETNPSVVFVSGTFIVVLEAFNTVDTSDAFVESIVVEIPEPEPEPEPEPVFDGGLITNGDFETGDTTGFDFFENGGTVEIDDSLSNGGTFSGRIVTNGASNPAIKQERIGGGVVQAGDVIQVNFDHIGVAVEPGAVFNVLLFGETPAGASFTHFFDPAPVLQNQWTSYTGTFTIPANTDVSDGISVLIEGVCGGGAGCSVTLNIDNLSVFLNP